MVEMTRVLEAADRRAAGELDQPDLKTDNRLMAAAIMRRRRSRVALLYSIKSDIKLRITPHWLTAAAHPAILLWT
jgi:hypothetical protein